MNAQHIWPEPPKDDPSYQAWQDFHKAYSADDTEYQNYETEFLQSEYQTVKTQKYGALSEQFDSVKMSPMVAKLT